MVTQKRQTPQDAANIPAKSNPLQAGNQAFHHPSQISMLEAPEIRTCKQIVNSQKDKQKNL